MEIQSAFNAGVQGFQKATETANNAAASIVESTSYRPEDFTLGQQVNDNTVEQNSASGNLSDLNQSIVELKVAEYQAKASAQVVKSADENLGTLLDVSV
ncbi:hypothetical protein [Thalassotalea sp. G2M2-11]|uniref:hypothetical protein n=1 Tax=Thalassotalea sp. G2M2-11 TaxID=2787627 RepID=UPI0019CFEBAD|nr:hypothetical protein [Thalassotalea sp. G2M2-11]